MSESVSIEKAIEFLTRCGIESYQHMGVLVVPAESCEELLSKTRTVRKLLSEIGYTKSWQVDPYYYEKHGVDSPVDVPEDPCS